MCLIERRTLLRRGDRNYAFSATFRPRAFDSQMVALVGIARLKFGRLFVAQAKITLQFQADPHVFSRIFLPGLSAFPVAFSPSFSSLSLSFDTG